MGIESGFGQFSPDQNLTPEEAKKATDRMRALELERIRKEAERSLTEAVESGTNEDERRLASEEGQAREDREAV